jgi:hypothetical protein
MEGKKETNHKGRKRKKKKKFVKFRDMLRKN